MMNQNCEKCGIYKTCASYCIGGRGSKKPDILFVGEAPGSKEDEDGRCFVGPAGALLHNRIRRFRLDKYKIRLTNTVRCWPNTDRVSTRKPRKTEVDYCFPFLIEELKKHGPNRLLVSVGKTATEAILGKSRKITQWGGVVIPTYDLQDKIRNLKDVPLMPVMHPSAVLHQRSNTRIFLSHMRSISTFMKRGKVSIKNNLGETRLLDDYFSIKKWVDNSIKNADTTAFDYETTDLDPYKGVPICVGMYNLVTRESVVLWFGEKINNRVKKLITAWLESDVPKIAHNAKFEIRWSFVHFQAEPNNIIDDTIHMHHLIEEESDHSLMFLSYRYTKCGGYDAWMKSFMGANNNIKDAPQKKIVEYCGGDVVVTGLIRDEMEKEIYKDKKLPVVYEEIMVPATYTLARIENRGMMISENKLRTAERKLKKTCNEVLNIVNKYDEVARTLYLCGQPKTPGINFRSTKQVATLMYKVLKLPVLLYTDTGAPSTAKKVIEALEEHHPILKLISEVRSAQYELGVIDQIRNKLREDGTVSCNWFHGYVVTGRLNCTNFNAQALKRDSLIRKAIVSRFDGGYILVADYQQLELMLVANESKEPKLIRVFNEGGDVHGSTAGEIFGKDYTDEQRYHAKRVNFGVVYGIGYRELAWQIKQPTKTQYAKKLLRRHRSTYPRVDAYIRYQRDFARRNGYVRSRIGRIRHLPDAKSLDRNIASRAQLQAGNYPIQAFAADIAAWSMVNLDKILIEGGYESCLVGQIHDSLIVDVHPREVRRVQTLARLVMVDMLMERFNYFDVPLSVDIKVGDSW